MNKYLLLLLFVLSNSSILSAQQDSINMVGFAGIAMEQGVEISWTTSGESGVLSFELERSLDAINFQHAATIESSLDGSVENSYQFEDEGIYRSVVYYRLQTKMNSGEEYSNIIAVVRNNMEELPAIMIYPTIVQHSINIIKNSEDDLRDAQIRIFNMNGILMHSQQISGDFIKINLDVTGYNAGAYIVELRKGKFASKAKFVKQH